MKFLSTITPKLTIIRTDRKIIVDEVANLAALFERKIQIEITVPSIWQGLKDAALNLFTNLCMPKLAYA